MDENLTIFLIGSGLVLVPMMFVKRKARRNYLVFMLIMLVIAFALLFL
ncbi:MAG: hypothetical protein JEY96_01615 [Bacteroidales bacterium]|nr:hypothetical protein [Bacteroidales bacterium]